MISAGRGAVQGCAAGHAGAAKDALPPAGGGATQERNRESSRGADNPARTAVAAAMVAAPGDQPG